MTSTNTAREKFRAIVCERLAYEIDDHQSDEDAIMSALDAFLRERDEEMAASLDRITTVSDQPENEGIADIHRSIGKAYIQKAQQLIRSRKEV